MLTASFDLFITYLRDRDTAVLIKDVWFYLFRKTAGLGSHFSEKGISDVRHWFRRFEQEL